MKITRIETRVRPVTTGTWLDERRVSTPLSAFGRFAGRRSSWRGPGADQVSVLVRTGDPDVFGIGQTRGGQVTEQLITGHLDPLIRGQEPREVRLRTEEMTRATAPYGAGGIGSMATSAVELALWDLLARSLNAPLYQLLAGGAGPLPYYLTCDDPVAVSWPGGPDAAAQPRAVKIAMAYGPADGPAGLQENLRAVQAARENLPAGVPLAVDCFMSWDVPYAAAFARRAGDRGLDWIEEPLPPHAVDEHARLRQLIAPVRVAAGEHLFGPAAIYAYLERGAVDLLQVDVTWCGGLAVAQTAASAAVTRGVGFAPHAGGTQPWTLHLLSTLGPLGLAEVLAGLPMAAAVPPCPGDQPGVGLDPRDAGFGHPDAP